MIQAHINEMVVNVMTLVGCLLKVAHRLAQLTIVTHSADFLNRGQPSDIRLPRHWYKSANAERAAT